MGRLRDYLDTYRKALAGELPPPDLSTLTPRQRARYEANMAAVERGLAESQAANAQWRADLEASSILHGPALPSHAPGPAPPVAAARASAAEFGEALRDTVRGIVGTPARDLQARRASEIGEVAARAEARAPYAAPAAPAVVVTRVATRGATQVQDLVAHLQACGLAARPDLVHGVHRVPDRISPHDTPHSERDRLVEWAVVHHPAPLPPAAEAYETAVFVRDAQLLARRLGEPSVIDEEVGALYCGAAGVASEHCFGIARLVGFTSPTIGGSLEHPHLDARTIGVAVLHRPVAGAAAARERLAAQAPLRDPLPSMHHEVLDWDAIRDRIQPDRRHPPAAPSPLPHLPSSPEELLLAYLEVVGVQPRDSYGAQVTRHTPERLSYAGQIADPLGPELPSADGRPRRRLHGAEHVVLSYRDRPEYIAGRERWAAYQREVLYARLDHLSGVRPPLAQPGRVDRLVNAINVVADPAWALDGWLESGGGEPSPFPYCWPPAP